MDECCATINIIVPIFNIKEQYLKKCIESLVNQTYKRIRIILVDDGSLDYCSQICDEYCASDNRIIVVHQVNQGVSQARNKGVDCSTNGYIMFVDPDDYLELDCCEKVLKKAIENDYDVTFFGYNCLGNEKLASFIKKKKLDYCFSITDSRKLQIDTIRKNHHKYPFNLSSPWGRLIKYDYYITYNIRFVPDMIKAQDLVMNLYLFENLKKFEFYGYRGYNYVLHNESVSFRYQPDILEKEIFLIREVLNFIEKYHNNDKEYAEAVSVLCLKNTNVISNTYLNHKDCKLSTKEKKNTINRWLEYPENEKYICRCSVKNVSGFKNKIILFLLKKGLIAIYLQLMHINLKFNQILPRLGLRHP